MRGRPLEPHAARDGHPLHAVLQGAEVVLHLALLAEDGAERAGGRVVVVEAVLGGDVAPDAGLSSGGDDP